MSIQESQLTLDVGLRSEPPLGSTFRLSGELSSLTQELRIDDLVQVLIMGADGEVVLSSYARCSGVGFVKHRPNNGPEWVERAHKIKLGESTA